MKQFILYLITVFLSVPMLYGQEATASSTGKENVTVHIITHKKDAKVYFQPQGDRTSQFVEIKPEQHTLTYSLQEPAYYQYIDSEMGYHTVYLTPGTDLKITDHGNRNISYTGTHAELNQFIEQHPFTGNTPETTIQSYSMEWLAYNDSVKEQYKKELAASSFPEEFVRIHSAFLDGQYVNIRINGPATLKIFSKDFNLPEHYYDFLQTLRFDDAYLLFYPKWFSTLQESLETMEKNGILPTSAEHFIKIYAERIENPILRSKFLVRYLDLVLQKGYSDDYPTYLADARPFILAEDRNELEEVAKRFEATKEKVKDIVRGSSMPEFTALDVEGNVYNSSSDKGKIRVLDFWFTGCIPCKAEMPYMEQLAEEMKEQNICFLSLSLDTGDQLFNTWKEMVKGKKDAMKHLNVPNGFKSELANHLGIRSVPRIVIIDGEGKIIDAFGKRPSDPKLRQQLEQLLDKEK